MSNIFICCLGNRLYQTFKHLTCVYCMISESIFESGHIGFIWENIFGEKKGEGG